MKNTLIRFTTFLLFILTTPLAAQHAGTWVEDVDVEPLGLVLEMDGSASMMMGDFFLESEPFELKGGGMARFVYEVKYTKPHNELDLKVVKQGTGEVILIYRAIFDMEPTGKMKLCTTFKNGDERPKQMLEGHTYVLTKYE